MEAYKPLFYLKKCHMLSSLFVSDAVISGIFHNCTQDVAFSIITVTKYQKYRP